MISEFQGEYRWLSNFWPVSIPMGGLVFPSVENAYQAYKCAREDQWGKFVSITPGAAKRVGKTVVLRKGWEEGKLVVMLTLLRLKFMNGELKQKLLATGDEELVEGNRWGDTFWGVCEGKGENNLGKLLMKVRSEIRSVTQ